jgi:tripartite-type tricarboxylate transporter receptor subunit TctC
MRTKIVCILIVIGMLVIGSNPAVYAQVKYPNKPIQLVVGYGPGGAQDLFWRAIKDDLEKVLKVPITIVNKAGAGGALAADFVANAKNDGYTLVAVGHSIKTVIPAIDPKAVISDIDVIALTFSMPFALVTRAESNFKSLKDVIAYGKEKPGILTCATQGVQSEAYFDLQFIAQGSGIKINHVPIPNAGDVMANVLGGHVDLALSTFASTLALHKEVAGAGNHYGAPPAGLSGYSHIFRTRTYPGYPGWCRGPVGAKEYAPRGFQCLAKCSGGRSRKPRNAGQP